MALCVVADTSVITPATCLCIMGMGARPSSACLHYPVGSQDVLDEMRKPELKAQFAENSTSVIPAPGNRWGGLLL